MRLFCSASKRNVAAVILSVGGLVIATTSKAQSLDELLAAVSINHPVIASSKRSIESAEKSVDSARGRYWPTISTVLEAGGNSDVALPNRSVAVEQTIWNAGATSARIETAIANVELTRRQLLRKEHELQLQVIESWKSAHTALGQADVARRAIERLREHERMMERRVKADISPSVELELIRSRLLQEQIQLQAAEVGFSLATKRLEQLTGFKELAAKLQKQPSPELTQDAERLTREYYVKSWVDVASRHPLVREADAEVVQGERQILTRRADRWPQVYARINRAFGDAGKTVAFIGVRHSLDAGGIITNELAALESQVEALRSNKDAAMLDIEEQIQSGLGRLQSSAKRFESVKIASESYTRIHESYVRQFIAGRKSWLDVMSAMREVSQNEYAKNEALYEFMSQLEKLKLIEVAARE